jgi:hypothetical protein
VMIELFFKTLKDRDQTLNKKFGLQTISTEQFYFIPGITYVIYSMTLEPRLVPSHRINIDTKLISRNELVTLLVITFLYCYCFGQYILISFNFSLILNYKNLYQTNVEFNDIENIQSKDLNLNVNDNVAINQPINNIQIKPIPIGGGRLRLRGGGNLSIFLFHLIHSLQDSNNNRTHKILTESFMVPNKEILLNYYSKSQIRHIHNKTRRTEGKQKMRYQNYIYIKQVKIKQSVERLRWRDGDDKYQTINLNKTILDGGRLRLRGGNDAYQNSLNKSNLDGGRYRKEKLIKTDKLIIQSQNVRSIYDEHKQSIKRDSIVNHIYKESKNSTRLAAFLLQETWISTHQQLKHWINKSQIKEEYSNHLQTATTHKQFENALQDLSLVSVSKTLKTKLAKYDFISNVQRFFIPN